VAAWLCRRHTEEPLQVLAGRLGLSRANSVPNLTRRVEVQLGTTPAFTEVLERIMERCARETKNKV
jgi:hypothetical protein